MTDKNKEQGTPDGASEEKPSSAPSDGRIVTFAEDAASSAEKNGAAKETTLQASSDMRKKALAIVAAIVVLAAIVCTVAFGSGAFQTTETDGASASGAVQKADVRPDSDRGSNDGNSSDDGSGEKVAEGTREETPSQSEGESAVSEAAPSSDSASAQSGRSDVGKTDGSSGQEATVPPSPDSTASPSVPVEPEAPAGITVSFSVVSDAVGSPVSFSKSLTLDEGATVFDALAAAGVDFVARDSAYGKYVAAIGGLAEKQHGGTSGWMYSVNGEVVMTSCSNCVLSQGDQVQWFYTVSG